MAKEKLLFYVALLLFYSSVAIGDSTFSFKKAELEYAKDLSQQARQMTLPAIQAKWFELQNMLGSKVKTDIQSPKSLASGVSDEEDGVSFRVFVSRSMGKNLLKTYAKAAKQYGAILVFNGLPEGSWHKLAELVTEISGEQPELVAIQIDNEAFDQFGITRVPSFVLSKNQDMFAENPQVTFDKITGSIGIRRVLELFAGYGQLSSIATNKLEYGSSQ